MVGATRRHDRIIGNVFALLWNAARGAGCRVYSEAVKLQAANDVIHYPDVTVSCGPEDDDPLIERDPCLVIEVTSPGTETTDRREKLAAYRRMPSLAAYLILDGDRPFVRRHFRDDSGTWRYGHLQDTGTFPVPCPEETTLSLDETYEGVL